MYFTNFKPKIFTDITKPASEYSIGSSGKILVIDYLSKRINTVVYPLLIDEERYS